MTGLPLLTGLTFNDSTITKFNRSDIYKVFNGYFIPKQRCISIGGRPLVTDSSKFAKQANCTTFDPSVIYGRTKAPVFAQYKPYWALYDKKALVFYAFFKQGIHESPNEFYRVRQVKILYFLEDDTMTILEIKQRDSGIPQGRMIKRGKIMKNPNGEYFTWKDLGIGKNIAINGIVYHIVSCDLFTREFLASQGLIMPEPEEMPPDPYIQRRFMKDSKSSCSQKKDKLRRFLEYDCKILLFNALWDDRDSEHGELLNCEIRYFLATDEMSVKLVLGANSGRDPCSILLKPTKIPKLWKDVPSTFWSCIFERTDDEISEFYGPKDLKIGETIFIYGRKFLLYDCDSFTRNYYQKALCIDQGPAMEIKEKPAPEPEPPMPPHDGFGGLADSMQNTKSFLPKPPKKDLIRQLLNANKYLTYECILEDLHPEDKVREFIVEYNLGEGTIRVNERLIRNSGFTFKRFLRFYDIKKPGTNPLNPDLYTPADFYIGANINIYGWRFKIVGTTVAVYRYMQANADKYPPQVIENIRNYLYNKGLLQEDLAQEIEELDFGEKKKERDNIVKDLEKVETDIEKCEQYLVPFDEEDPGEATEPPEPKKYEYGIKPVTGICPYPFNVKAESKQCKTAEEIMKAGEFDTPEQKLKKYYANILRQQRHICQDQDKPK